MNISSPINSPPLSPITPDRSEAPKSDQGGATTSSDRSVQPSAQTVPAPSSGKIVDLTA